MTSLFVFFVHGSVSDLKIVTKPTMGVESVITLAVFYDTHTCAITISGSPIVIEYLETREAWFLEDPDDRLALFKQLFDQLKARYELKPDHIYASLENNWTAPGAEYPTPSVVDVINHLQPGAVILPSGTPSCTKFSHYWMSYYNCPELELNESFVIPENYYKEEELSDAKIAEFNERAQRLHLRCAPPMAAFDKSHLVRCIRILLDRIVAKKLAHESEVALPHSVKISANSFDASSYFVKSLEILTNANHGDCERIPARDKPDEIKDEEGEKNSGDITSTGRRGRDDLLTVWIGSLVRKKLNTNTKKPVNMSSTQIAIEDQSKLIVVELLDQNLNLSAPRLKPNDKCFSNKRNCWLRFFYCCGSEGSIVPSYEPMMLVN